MARCAVADPARGTRVTVPRDRRGAVAIPGLFDARPGPPHGGDGRSSRDAADALVAPTHAQLSRLEAEVVAPLPPRRDGAQCATLASRLGEHAGAVACASAAASAECERG